jgi:hypothetical protein
LRQDFQRRALASDAEEALFTFDAAAPSCTSVIDKSLTARGFQMPHWDELVAGVNRIDAARFESPFDALNATDPAMIISAGLAFDPDPRYMSRLIRALVHDSLADVAGWSDVRRRFARYEEYKREFMQDLVHTLLLSHDGLIGLQELEGPDNQVTRFGPFYEHPEMAYLIQARRENRMVRVGLNPWYHGPAVDLGRLARSFHHRAGGHPKIGVIRLPEESRQSVFDLTDVLAERVAAGHAELNAEPFELAAK